MAYILILNHASSPGGHICTPDVPRSQAQKQAKHFLRRRPPLRRVAVMKTRLHHRVMSSK